MQKRIPRLVYSKKQAAETFGVRLGWLEQDLGLDEFDEFNDSAPSTVADDVRLEAQAPWL